MPQHSLTLLEFMTRLAVGAVLGLIIGYERQWRERPAGLHTAGLVATGAALYATIQPAFEGGGGERIIANIVTGVGFLAGGVIFREGGSVSGLNTAATIWSSAAVGALAGIGLFRESAIAALTIVAINLLMEPAVRAIDRRIESKRRH